MPRALALRAFAPAACAILLAPAALASTLALPPDPLAQQIRAGEPAGLPPAGALDALGDASGSFRKASSSGQAVALDDGTAENAIALARASGAPFRLSDLATSVQSRPRTDAAARAFALPLDNVLAALALGAPPATGALQDLLTRSVAFATSDALTRRANLSDENAQGGLALLANGVPLDPQALVSFQDVSKGSSATRQLAAAHEDPSLAQSVSLPRDVAQAAEPLLRANATVAPMDLANATLRSSDGGSDFRNVSLPEQTVFGALAMRNNGMAVQAADLLDVDQREVASRTDAAAIALDRGTALDALLLGAGP
jgi:hypothetical protein